MRDHFALCRALTAGLCYFEGSFFLCRNFLKSKR
jgi:hypothetical protein